MKKHSFIFFFALILLFSHIELSAHELIDFSLEQLMDVEISVSLLSRRTQELSKTPASVFVLTSEDIERSGMTTIPEILRLVPGLDIARLSGGNWSVNSRGSNKKFASDFIVMIDGKIVSSASLNSIEWSTIDTFISDVDRIEVVEGSGGTTWDCNAVNGIINIITKDSHRTLGNRISLLYGNADSKHLAVRHGGTFGDNGAYRFFFKGAKNEPFQEFNSARADDQVKSLRTGIRLDWKKSDDITFKFLGNAYQHTLQEKITRSKLSTSGIVNANSYVNANTGSGYDFLFSVDRKVDEEENYKLQLYFDKSLRSERAISGNVQTLDIDFQHSLIAFTNHNLVWGLGYKRRSDSFSLNGFSGNVFPLSNRQETLSAFVQDDITLIPNNLVLTLGSKFYKNSYVDSQNAPSAKLMWTPNAKHGFWSSFSEAHRSPIRSETSVSMPLGFAVDPVTGVIGEAYLKSNSMINQGKLEPEYLKAKEIGYRFNPNRKFSLSLNYYKHEYYNLLGITKHSLSGLIPTPSPHFRLTLTPANFSSSIYDGILVSSKWQVRNDWKIFMGYSTLWIDVPSDISRGTSPDTTWFVRSNYDLNDSFKIDTYLSHTSAYTFVHDLNGETDIDYQVRLDLRFNWKCNDFISVSLGGQNLLSKWHREIGSSFDEIPSEIPRNYYLKVVMDF